MKESNGGNMLYSYKTMNCYMKTFKVLKLYDILADLIINNADKKEIDLIVKKIELAIKKETTAYNKLSYLDIERFSSELNSIPKDDVLLYHIRVKCRLAIAYDKLGSYTIKNNGLFGDIDDDVELSLIDIVNSKIVLDIHKLLSKKFNELSLEDDKSKDYAEKMNVLNSQHFIYKASLRELSEILLLTYSYDISKMPDIDLSLVERQLFEEKGIKLSLKSVFKNNIFDDVLDLIDRFENIPLDPDDVESIYDNLFFVTQLDVLLSYLDKEQLMYISSYCNEIKADNKMVLGNIKRLVISKIIEL